MLAGKEAALSSYKSYDNNVPQNLSKGEFFGLQNLSKNKDSIIQKSDKGNSVVIVDRQDYKKKMDDILLIKRNLGKSVWKMTLYWILLSIKKTMLIRFSKNFLSLIVW